jgi:hypothetical protein
MKLKEYLNLCGNGHTNPPKIKKYKIGYREFEVSEPKN